MPDEPEDDSRHTLGRNPATGPGAVRGIQCSNVLPIVSVVGPNYQFQLLPTLSSMFSESLSGTALGAVRGGVNITADIMRVARFLQFYAL